VLASAEPQLWADTIHELLLDRPALNRLAVRAPAGAARFRDDVHAAEMLTLYERVLGSPGGVGLAVRVGARADERVGAPWPG
jgi:hypothetical protein